MPPLIVVALNEGAATAPVNVAPDKFAFVTICDCNVDTAAAEPNKELTFVLPLNKVPALNVVADKATPVAVPEKLKLLIKGESTRLTVGLFAVPPVVIFVPGCTLVMSFPSAVVKKIEYKFVLPL